MAHNDHVFPVNGQVNGTTVPTPSQLEQLDQLASESLNGDSGGTWSPVDPIIIGGAGVSAPYGVFHGVTTGAEGLGGKLILGDNDYPTFLGAQQRTSTFHLSDMARLQDDYKYGAGLLGNINDAFTISPSGILLSLTNTGSVTQYIAVHLPDFRFPPGATIINATLRFRSTVKPFGFGWSTTYNPQFRITRVNLIGTPMQTLLSTGGGYVTGAMTTIDQMYNGGSPQSLVFTPDQNNVVDATNPGNWFYLLEIKDPSGAACLYHSLTVNFGSITTLQPGV